jgi:hypothetical protein
MTDMHFGVAQHLGAVKIRNRRAMLCAQTAITEGYREQIGALSCLKMHLRTHLYELAK